MVFGNCDHIGIRDQRSEAAAAVGGGGGGGGRGVGILPYLKFGSKWSMPSMLPKEGTLVSTPLRLPYWFICASYSKQRHSEKKDMKGGNKLSTSSHSLK